MTNLETKETCPCTPAEEGAPFEKNSNPNQLVVHVDRSKGDKLGIQVNGGQGGLVVTNIKAEGLIPDWNTENPKQASSGGR